MISTEGPGISTRKWLLPLVGTLVVGFLGYIGLGLWTLHTADIEDVSLCVTEDDTHHIPNAVCEYYLFQFRGTPSDIKYLESRAGLAFFFGVENREMRRRLMSFFLEKGLSINQPSAIADYPPLHAAILMNDAKLVEFLLTHGADPDQKDKRRRLTAPEFVKLLKRKNPERDWSNVTGLLEPQS